MAGGGARKRIVFYAGALEDGEGFRDLCAAQQVVHADGGRDAGGVEGVRGRGGDDFQIALRAQVFDAGVEGAERGFLRADVLEADVLQAERGDLRQYGQAIRHRAVLPGEHEDEIHGCIMLIAALPVQ